MPFGQLISAACKRKRNGLQNRQYDAEQQCRPKARHFKAADDFGTQQNNQSVDHEQEQSESNNRNRQGKKH